MLDIGTHLKNRLCNLSPNAITLIRMVLAWFASTFFVSTVHWACIQFLATYCAPWSILGPVHNLLHMASPLCGSINKFQAALSTHYFLRWEAAAGSAILYFKSIDAWRKAKQ
jgi:hypothetical protein